MMRHARTVAELRRELAGRVADGERVVLVPTMGALHEGHLRLVDRARELGDLVVLSIFVNPLQFGAGEDFERYPRPVEQDERLARERGVDVLFVPDADVMYPGGEPHVRVEPGRLGDVLCGAFRPGHFAGVLTVVAKLFHMVRPDVAVFGQKDYQQAALIRRMVHDLDFPLRIDVAPTVRDADGLALSSRNAYLEPDERRAAGAIWRGLSAAQAAFRAGETRASSLAELVRAELEGAGFRVQYVEVVDPDTLAAVDDAGDGALLAVAGHVGRTRLIDNVLLSAG
jgi:pantoate--beta-alanine ligase